MKKGVFFAAAAILLTALPAEAQLLRRRPVLQQIVTSPVTQQLLGLAASQFLPNNPLGSLDLSSLLNKTTTTKITVDSSVTTNINATKSNLNDANTIMQKLLEKNGIKKASSTKSGVTEDDPGTVP